MVETVTLLKLLRLRLINCSELCLPVAIGLLRPMTQGANIPAGPEFGGAGHLVASLRTRYVGSAAFCSIRITATGLWPWGGSPAVKGGGKVDHLDVDIVAVEKCTVLCHP